MVTEITVALIGVLTTILSGVVTFILTRRKYNLEVDSKKIQNMNDSFDYYKKVTDETMRELNQKIETLQKENDSLRKQVYDLHSQMLNLMGSICLDATCKLRKTGLAPDTHIS